MALTSGFFNSYAGDRKYDAEQISEIFDGILADGIIPSQGEKFAVTATTGMNVSVGTGRAWFNHTWTKNDSAMVLEVPVSDITRPRIDAVVLEVNRSADVRANSIKIISGEAAVTPTKPTLSMNGIVNQYPLAYITVGAGVEEITAANIENAIGLTPTVFATGVLQTTPLDDLWAQWEGEFDAWFDNIKTQLSGDVVANLQGQIDGKVNISDKATDADILSPTSNDKWMTPLSTKKLVEGLDGKVGDIKFSTRNLEAETNGKWIACDGRTLSVSAYPTLTSHPSIACRLEEWKNNLVNFGSATPLPFTPNTFVLNNDGTSINSFWISSNTLNRMYRNLYAGESTTQSSTITSAHAIWFVFVKDAYVYVAYAYNNSAYLRRFPMYNVNATGDQIASIGLPISIASSGSSPTVSLISNGRYMVYIGYSSGSFYNPLVILDTNALTFTTPTFPSDSTGVYSVNFHGMDCIQKSGDTLVFLKGSTEYNYKINRIDAYISKDNGSTFSSLAHFFADKFTVTGFFIRKNRMFFYNKEDNKLYSADLLTGGTSSSTLGSGIANSFSYANGITDVENKSGIFMTYADEIYYFYNRTQIQKLAFSSNGELIGTGGDVSSEFNNILDDYNGISLSGDLSVAYDAPMKLKDGVYFALGNSKWVTSYRNPKPYELTDCYVIVDLIHKKIMIPAAIPKVSTSSVVPGNFSFSANSNPNRGVLITRSDSPSSALHYMCISRFTMNYGRVNLNHQNGYIKAKE